MLSAMKTLLVLAALSAILRLSATQSTCNTASSSNYFFTSNSQATQYGIASGTSMTAQCAPGYVSYYDLNTLSFPIYCYNGNWYFTAKTTSASPYDYASCIAKPNWCSSTNLNLTWTVTPSYVFPTSVGTNLNVWCKAGKLGNFRGNGTYISVFCGSSADGTTGVWQSIDYCSGAISIKIKALFVLIAATVGLVMRLV